MAGSIPVHLRHSSRGRNPSAGASSMLGGWPEAVSARTGFAASSSHSPKAMIGVLALFVSIVVVLLSVSPAGAEARLLSSTPVDGASLSSLRQIDFEFDSLLIPDGATITLVKLDGTEFLVDTTVEERTLSGTVIDELPSGNYEVGYSVRSADGDTNTGTIRVGVDSPAQSLSGGLLAVVGIGVGLFLYLLLVFRADKNRRPPRRAAE